MRKTVPPAILERAQAAIAMHGNSKIIAAQIRALTGNLAVLDDAVVLFDHTDEVEPSAIGALSVCRSHDGHQIMAKIERARKTGEALVIMASGETRELLLQNATPVIAIIP